MHPKGPQNNTINQFSGVEARSPRGDHPLNGSLNRPYYNNYSKYLIGLLMLYCNDQNSTVRNAQRICLVDSLLNQFNCVDHLNKYRFLPPGGQRKDAVRSSWARFCHLCFWTLLRILGISHILNLGWSWTPNFG